MVDETGETTKPPDNIKSLTPFSHATTAIDSLMMRDRKQSVAMPQTTRPSEQAGSLYSKNRFPRVGKRMASQAPKKYMVNFCRCMCHG